MFLSGAFFSGQKNLVTFRLLSENRQTGSQKYQAHNLRVADSNPAPATGPLKSTHTAILPDSHLGLICISSRWV